MDRPTATDPNFMARLQAYWQHVLVGKAGPADDIFFPRAAYLQVKELSNAGGDWDTRLYYDYTMDLTADHQLATTGAPTGASIKVLGVDVPDASVRWVPPGVEVNSIGYWQVSYARVRYSVAGQERSFAISSMISWRGQWYFVHLGPNWRPGEGGWVCTPEPVTALPISAGCLRG